MTSLISYDVIIIGGGPAGLAAAYSAANNGAQKVLIIERDRELGGILQQCIHNGFGLHRFKQELTGPGYASRYIKMIKQNDIIEVMLNTMVLNVATDRTVTAVNAEQGLLTVQAKAVVFAMGCRERTRGAIRIPGERPAGIFTAGAAQRMVNMEGYLPGERIVIVGSGDIGLIMARRLTLEGAKVQAVVEIMPYSNGLTRNVVQCLEDYGIPLYLSHSIVDIHGTDRVTGVTCAKVDNNMKPIAGTTFTILCDCLLLSVGLIPENELTFGLGIDMDVNTGGPIVDQYRQTNLPGFFSAGNVVHVHDLVDFVSDEGDTAGKYAALFATEKLPLRPKVVNITGGNGIRTVVPQRIITDNQEDSDKTLRLYIRVKDPQRNIELKIVGGNKLLYNRMMPVAKPGEMIVADLQDSSLCNLEENVVVSVSQAVKE